MSSSERTFLVTGGSQGIGRAVVERLVAAGRRVAFTYNSDRAAALELVETSNGLAHAYQFSLSDRPSALTLIREVEQNVGRLFGLVNNAAVVRSELMAMMSDDSWDTIIDTNLGGTFRVTREALRAIVPHRWGGSIVNVASLSAVDGVAGQTAYAASKAGILAMTRCLSREMGRRKIRVNAVVPGFVETKMTNDVGEAAVRKLRERESLPHGVSTSGVSAAVVFLLSDDAGDVTGQALHVDAGASA
jgi:3-oxoacyl-[acyl-carrier protein] reductase